MLQYFYVDILLRKENQKLETSVFISYTSVDTDTVRNYAASLQAAFLVLQSRPKHSYQKNSTISFIDNAFDYAIRYKEASTYFHQISHCLLNNAFVSTQDSIDESKIAIYLKEIQEFNIVNKIDPTSDNMFNKLIHKQFNGFHSLLILPAPLLKQIAISIVQFKHLIAFLKKRAVEAVRLQYIACCIHNRLSRSPSPQKKEPPVGGVKIGGPQLDYLRHAAGILYHKHLLKLSTAP